MTDTSVSISNNYKYGTISMLKEETVREDMSSHYSSDDKIEYSELCVDAAASVLYAITSKFIMKRETTLAKKFIDFEYHHLLSFPANNKEGIPIIITLDENTSFDMLKSAVQSITKPLVDNIRDKKGINIDIEFQEISNSEILIGVLWERGDIYIGQKTRKRNYQNQ